MKRTIILIAFVYCFSSGIVFSQSSGSEKQEPNSTGAQKRLAQSPSLVFSEVEPVIHQKSRVLPALPSFLPYVDKSHSIYAVVRSVSDSGYDILLANAIPCEGQNWCLYGSVRGSIEPFNHTFNHATPAASPMSLHKGIQGKFIEATCDTYCTEAYAEWKEDGYYYSIGMKAGKRDQLRKMANSAIDSGGPKVGGG
jgi:hypothetical protein